MEEAYLRELVHFNQCELVFLLKIEPERFGKPIQEEIRSVRQATDTVQSLLDHTRNKITKLLKDTTEKEIEAESVNVSLTIKDCNLLGDTPCKQLIAGDSKHLVFEVLDQHFKVVLNAPLVQTLILPFVFYVDYSTRPRKFKSLFTIKELCEFVWYRSADKQNWSEISNDFFYKPTKGDLNNYLKLKCVPKNKTDTGPIVEVISETSVIEMPALPHCPFEERQKYTKTFLSRNKFRVVSYNILSDVYSDSTAQYPYCTPQALSVEYRKQLIIKELLGYKADIICLQETDMKLFQHFFRKKLQNAGYRSVFHQKGNRIPEGLTCVFKGTRFKKLESKQIVFSEEIRNNDMYNRLNKAVKQDDTVKELLLKQPTSLQVTVLKCMENNEIVIVANTHLYYHSEANIVRYIQSIMAAMFMSDVYTKWNKAAKKDNAKVSIVFCGDFNSRPSSLVFNYLTKHVMNYQETSGLTLLLEKFKNPRPLSSACGTPEFTNYTSDFKGCLDYIFYQPERLSVIQSVPIPTEAVLSKNVALPSKVFPSDHVALIADLQWI